MNASSHSTATFVRVEGALLRRPTLATAAWLAANAQTFGQRAFGLGTVLAAAPLALRGTPLADPATALRLAWAGLRDVSEDRLEILGEAYYRAHLADAIRPAGRTALDRARAMGDRIVLVSDNLDVVAKHLAADLGADHLVCNRLELRRERATGRLADPVIGGSLGGSRLVAFAVEHGFELARCGAVGSRGADGVLLAAVARPCAVAPDADLRRLARDLDWPILVDGGSR
jgi:putative phosphoserine phosphatase / 1-acylglycerol-3-phosphate O-acyltransferase